MKHLLALVLTVLNVSIALAEDTIKIGLLASMSDEWASLGKNSLRGAEIAVSEINSSGGVGGRQIQLEVEDTLEANSGARAVSAYQSLRQRGIQLFIGPSGTPAGMSLAPIITSQKVVVVTPSVGVRDFSDAGPNIFNSRGVDEQGSAAMARLAVQRGWKRAAILSSQQPWEQAQGEAFRREFERLGGTIAEHAAPLPETNDFRTIIAKMLITKPQVIFLSNYNRMAVAAKQLAELGYTGPKLTTILDNSIVQSAAGALNNAEFASFVGPTETFRKRFRAAYSAEPDFGADTSYDSVIALAHALRATHNLDSLEVSGQLAAVKFEGAAGEFSFDKDRIAQRKLKQFVVKDGRISEVVGEG